MLRWLRGALAAAVCTQRLVKAIVTVHHSPLPHSNMIPQARPSCSARTVFLSSWSSLFFQLRATLSFHGCLEPHLAFLLFCGPHHHHSIEVPSSSPDPAAWASATFLVSWSSWVCRRVCVLYLRGEEYARSRQSQAAPSRAGNPARKGGGRKVEVLKETATPARASRGIRVLMYACTCRAVRSHTS